MTNPAKKIKAHIQEELGKIIVGTDTNLDALAIGIIAGGSFLLTGTPGTGKSLLSKALIELLGQASARIDCGNDIEFTNILHALSSNGTHVTKTQAVQLLYLVGLNRLTPNTQAILLPIMEEHQLLNLGEIIRLGNAFRVIASYDPGCFDDTYPVLEALLDRFFISTSMAAIDADQQREILKSRTYPRVEPAQTQKLNSLPADLITQAREQTNTINILDTVYDYIIQIIQSLWHHPDIRHGASQRGPLSVIHAARIHASLMERDYVNPDDVQAVIGYCLGHRLQLTSDALLDGTQIGGIITSVVQQTELPKNATDQN